VIFTVLESRVAAPLVVRAAPYAKRILNTENVEHRLLKQDIASREADSSHNERVKLQMRHRLVLEEECSLARFVHAFWAVSQEDLDALRECNASTVQSYVIPNGIDTERRPYDLRPDKAQSDTIIFCGTLNYAPNRDALAWLLKQIWPRIRKLRTNTKLLVVGRGATRGDFEGADAAFGVEFVGEVDDVVPYYRRAGVCLVPLKSGSGTRLKILEAMSLGNPVVCTRLAAEGLDVVDENHMVIRDSEDELAKAVTDLLDNPGRFDAIRLKARAQVERLYDWSVVGSAMNASIEAELARAVDAGRKS